MQNIFPIDYPIASILPIFVKLLVSVALGSVVGYEREIHERPAGLRTHVLVCTGATLFMILSLSFHNDPGRIAAQVVSGIGFLGAGTILHQGNIIHGLTTAASLWMVAAIGMAVGMGGTFFLVASFAAILVFVTLAGMRRFEPFLGKKNTFILRVQFSRGRPEILGQVLQGLSGIGVEVESILSGRTGEECRTYSVRLALPGKVTPEAVVEKLEEVDGLDKFKLT
jgi:putative Mg2+ transporter-C (MgtC) family protein